MIRCVLSGGPSGPVAQGVLVAVCGGGWGVIDIGGRRIMGPLVPVMRGRWDGGEGQ